MSDHKHGDMDIKSHEETFNGFIKFVTWSVVLILILLVFLAIFAS